jgi:hypothetical protein
MAGPKKPTSAPVSHSDRRNGKAPKKNPGVSPQAHNGKTVDGYTPDRVAQRAAIRRVAARVASDG